MSFSDIKPFPRVVIIAAVVGGLGYAANHFAGGWLDKQAVKATEAAAAPAAVVEPSAPTPAPVAPVARPKEVPSPTVAPQVVTEVSQDQALNKLLQKGQK